jgi:flagellar hook-basal body complex protein FliE
MRIGDSSGYGSMMSAALQQRRQEMKIDSGTDLRIGGEPGTPDAKKPERVEGPSFTSVLEETALAASEKQNEAEQKTTALAAGTSDDLHGTMITAKEAEISMKLVGSVRDKLMDAFHELWRINV